MKHYQHYIDGQWSEASDGGRIETVNPANGEIWATVPAATEQDVDRAVAASKSALLEGPWSQMTATRRGAMIYRLGELCVESAVRLGDIETMDSGKLARETRSQTAYVGDYYRYYAGLADKIQGATLPIDKVDMQVFTHRVPIGVVAAIVPWNAQMFLASTKLGPALAAGNTVVLKASEHAPAPMFEFAALIDRAGFPPGVVNVITGYGEPCGRALTGHPDVARVAFTGGPETARHVVHNTAQNFAHLSLELGGKSPMLIFDDADLDGAVNAVVAGNFGASGQSCVAGSRVLVQTGIHDRLMDRLVARTKDIIVGDPLDDATHVGPLATVAQIERIDRVVAQSLRQGTRLCVGGSRPSEPAAGNYWLPTVLSCPDQRIPSVQEELFGPVCSVLKFDTEAAGIALANDSPFALGAGVFTENLARGMRVSKAIRSGIVWVNTYRAVSPMSPFGGFGQSGYGREAGVDAIHDYTRTKTVWINTGTEPMANPFVMR